MTDFSSRIANAPTPYANCGAGWPVATWPWRSVIIGIVILLILPVPAFMLDGLLAISITSSVLILMTATLIKKPLEFTSFPSVLLVATLYRLALNIASTRLILSHGHEGIHGAGHVIETFGKLMMGGSFIIGVIVFAILVLVNFVVITKGSGRIAEVAARFTLDSMPGKQMAIDADLSSGLIDETVAKQRRKDLEAESTFFGAMDGASKFVRGDAVAGLVILCINVIGGILIGVIQHKVPIGQAFSTYTIMSIGDGLVSQIPALIISIAAGFLVSKAGVEGAADKALVTQLAMNPVSMGMVSAASPALWPSSPACRSSRSPWSPSAPGTIAYRRSQKMRRAGEGRDQTDVRPNRKKSRSARPWPSTRSRSSWATACWA
jgi:flagellar biosynthesis protein FlhA